MNVSKVREIRVGRKISRIHPVLYKKSSPCFSEDSGVIYFQILLSPVTGVTRVMFSVMSACHSFFPQREKGHVGESSTEGQGPCTGSWPPSVQDPAITPDTFKFVHAPTVGKLAIGIQLKYLFVYLSCHIDEAFVVSSIPIFFMLLFLFCVKLLIMPDRCQW